MKIPPEIYFYDTIYHDDVQIVYVIVQQCDCEHLSSTNEHLSFFFTILVINFAKDAYLNVLNLATGQSLTSSEISDLSFAGVLFLLPIAAIIRPRIHTVFTKLLQAFRFVLSFWRRGE